ncbi:MAG: Hpt domain-containing protein [Hyphomicrobiaceae bacterium]
MDLVNNDLRALIEKHVHSLKRDGAAILEILDGPYPDPEHLWPLTHKFKGGAGTIGFQQIHAAAQNLHAAVKSRAAQQRPIDAECRQLAEQFRLLLEDLRPEHSALLS